MTQAASLAASVVGLPEIAQAEPKKGGHLRFGLPHGSSADSLDPGKIDNGFIQLNPQAGFFRDRDKAVVSQGEGLTGEFLAEGAFLDTIFKPITVREGSQGMQ